MIARDLDGRIYADADGKALFQSLNTQLPNIKADEFGKYEAGVIYTDPGKLAPDPAAVPKSAAEKMDQMKEDFKATDIPMISEAAEAVAAARNNSRLLLIGAGALMLLLVLRR